MPQEISRPSSSIRLVSAAATRLTYATSVNPSPLTVSLPGTNPTLGSLVVVITNSEGADVQVQNITFMVPVGGSSNTLTPSSAGIQTAVSDPVHWVFSGPSSPVSSGTADYVLGPATGTSVILAAGTSVVVQLYEIKTNTSPGTATIAIKEMIAGTPTFGGFSVTTFPYGFYFESLAATMLVNSALVPVSQVAYGSQVTLIWNSSVVDTRAHQIYYSTAQGQQQATPTSYDQWLSPPLHSDTVFTVVVTAAVEGGQPITASLSASVAVTQPDLITNTIGIGNTDPKNKLHIGSGVSTISRDRVSVVVATKATETGIAIAQEGGSLGAVNLLLQASGAGAYIGTTSDHPLVLRTGDHDRVSVDKDGTFTASSGARIAGQLSVPGPVSMFGSYQGKQVNTNYVAATDGIVCALITGANGQDASDILLDGMVNGRPICQAFGFHNPTRGSFPSSLTFPVPKGATWQVKRTDNPNNQNSLTVVVSWMPLGTTQTSAD